MNILIISVFGGFRVFEGKSKGPPSNQLGKEELLMGEKREESCVGRKQLQLGEPGGRGKERRARWRKDERLELGGQGFGTENPGKCCGVRGVSSY